MATLLYCAECDRPLTKATVQIPTRDGTLSYGPKCGARFIVKKERKPRKPSVRKPKPKPDYGQQDWINQL